MKVQHWAMALALSAVVMSAISCDDKDDQSDRPVPPSAARPASASSDSSNSSTAASETATPAPGWNTVDAAMAEFFKTPAQPPTIAPAALQDLVGEWKATIT